MISLFPGEAGPRRLGLLIMAKGRFIPAGRKTPATSGRTTIPFPVFRRQRAGLSTPDGLQLFSPSDHGITFEDGGPDENWDAVGEPMLVFDPPTLSTETMPTGQQWTVFCEGPDDARGSVMAWINYFTEELNLRSDGEDFATVSLTSGDKPSYDFAPTNLFFADDPLVEIGASTLAGLCLEPQGVRICHGLIVVWGGAFSDQGNDTWRKDRYWVAFGNVTTPDTFYLSVSDPNPLLDGATPQADGSLTQIYSGELFSLDGNGPGNVMYAVVTNYTIPKDGVSAVVLAKITRSSESSPWRPSGVVEVVNSERIGTHIHSGIVYRYGQSGLCLDYFAGDNSNYNYAARIRRNDEDILDGSSVVSEGISWRTKGDGWTEAVLQGLSVEDGDYAGMGCQGVQSAIQRDSDGVPWVYMGPDEFFTPVVRYVPAEPNDGDVFSLKRLPGMPNGRAHIMRRGDGENRGKQFNGFAVSRYDCSRWDQPLVYTILPGGLWPEFGVDSEVESEERAMASRVLIVDRGFGGFCFWPNESITTDFWVAGADDTIISNSVVVNGELLRAALDKAPAVTPTVVTPGGFCLDPNALGVLNAAGGGNTLELNDLSSVGGYEWIPGQGGWRITPPEDFPDTAITSAFLGRPRLGTQSAALDLNDFPEEDGPDSSRRAQMRMGIYVPTTKYGSAIDMEFELNAAAPFSGNGPKVSALTNITSLEWQRVECEMDLAQFIGQGGGNDGDPAPRLAGPLTVIDGFNVYGPTDLFMSFTVIRPNAGLVLRPTVPGETYDDDIASTPFNGSGTSWTSEAVLRVPLFGWDSTTQFPREFALASWTDAAASSIITASIDLSDHTLVLRSTEGVNVEVASESLGRKVYRGDEIRLSLSRSGSSLVLSVWHVGILTEVTLALSSTDPRPSKILWGSDGSLTTGIEVAVTEETPLL